MQLTYMFSHGFHGLEISFEHNKKISVYNSSSRPTQLANKSVFFHEKSFYFKANIAKKLSADIFLFISMSLTNLVEFLTMNSFLVLIINLTKLLLALLISFFPFIVPQKCKIVPST